MLTTSIFPGRYVQGVGKTQRVRTGARSACRSA